MNQHLEGFDGLPAASGKFMPVKVCRGAFQIIGN